MIRKNFRVLALCLIAMGCATATSHRSGDGRVVTLSTRWGVKQRILILPADRDTKGTVILFKGGRGQSPFIVVGESYSLGGNFLVRSAPLFARRGFNAVVIDTPSDHPGGIDRAFRASPKHRKDIQAVVSYLVSKGKTPIFLVGTSLGTHSVSYLAKEMTSDHIKGIVLTSSMNDITLGPTQYPVLFVHHLHDGCFVTRYSEAVQNYDALSSPKKAFLTVRGGVEGYGQACGAFREHGFIGMEKEVVNAITDWLEGKPIPDEIAP